MRIGGVDVEFDEARRIASSHFQLTPEETPDEVTQKPTAYYGYPAYDSYPGGPSDLLSPTDLLAPVLLNVRASLRAYYELLDRIPELNAVLARVSVLDELQNATDDQLMAFGDLFAILDGAGTPGVRGTTLAKVLHRKRPRFIPLYDEQIRRCYQDAPGAPVPWVKGRPWSEFAILFAAAVRTDLVRDYEQWAELAALSPTAPITALRALDIVGWHLGREAFPPVAT